MRLHIRLLGPTLALSLLTSAGCATGDAAGGWEAAIDTVADTVVVRTLAGRVWATDMQLVPEVRIGVLEGDESYLLGSVRGLAVSPDGDIFVLDSQVPVLRRYGQDGVHLGDLGRSGGGPGEYKSPDGGLAVLSDGRIVLRDPGKAMLVVFSPDGEPLSEWALPSGGGFSTSRRLYRDSLDRVYPIVLRERGQSVFDWKMGLARVNPDGTHTDTLATPDWDYEAPRISGQREGSTSINNVPFSPNEQWAMGPAGQFVGGVSTEYRIVITPVAGLPMRIERAAEPVPVDPEERADAEARATENMVRNFPGWKWNGPPVPETKPPFRSVFVAEDNRIWVLRSQPGVATMGALEARTEKERTGRTPVRFREPVLFDVFDDAGRYLGEVHAPDGFSTTPEPVFRGDRVWAVERDELDVQYVVRYRLEPVAPAT